MAAGPSPIIDTPAVRELLPLVPVLGSLEDAQWSSLLDLEHIAAERGPGGQVVWPVMLPEAPRGELFSQRVEALRQTGQAGVYARWLRASGIIRQCPVWCRSEDHPRAAIWDPDRDVEHIAWSVEVPVEQGSNGPGAISVQVSTFQDLPAQVWLIGAEVLTGAEARHLADVLAQAADVLADILGE
jgi:hypothetical protein